MHLFWEVREAADQHVAAVEKCIPVKMTGGFVDRSYCSCCTFPLFSGVQKSQGAHTLSDQFQLHADMLFSAIRIMIQVAPGELVRFTQQLLSNPSWDCLMFSPTFNRILSWADSCLSTMFSITFVIRLVPWPCLFALSGCSSWLLRFENTKHARHSVGVWDVTVTAINSFFEALIFRD